MQDDLLELPQLLDREALGGVLCGDLRGDGVGPNAVDAIQCSGAVDAMLSP